MPGGVEGGLIPPYPIDLSYIQSFIQMLKSDSRIFQIVL